MTTPRGHTIALLVTTYRRNARLLRLVAQLQRLIAGYTAGGTGGNRYFVCVSDSDRANPVALPPGVSYRVNTGEGFDDNFTGACKALCGAADFVFAFGDDDLPTPFVNPLVVIDAALAAGDADVTMFNHVSYAEGEMLQLSERYYRVAETVNLAVDPLPIVSMRLPRYVALLYRSSFVERLQPVLAAFRSTRHAYAVPVLLAAAARRLAFFDYPVCLFDSADKTDGAWAGGSEVLRGLRLFLQQIQPHLPPADFAAMQAGFQHNYFDNPSLNPTAVPQPLAA